MATHGYLTAVHKMFERGLLYSKRDGTSQIRDMNSEVLENIKEGYSYFVEWADMLFLESKRNFVIADMKKISNYTAPRRRHMLCIKLLVITVDVKVTLYSCD